MFSSQLEGSSGGFMSQLSQGPGSTPPARVRESQGIYPVTVKQLTEASQTGDGKSNFQIDGTDVTNVTLIGMFFDKVERVTDVGFIIDDGTGWVSCKRWINETFDKNEMEILSDGTYVRVIGHLNLFQDQRHLVAFSLRPVNNFDEVTYHFIHCIHVHLKKSDKKVPERVNILPEKSGFRSSESKEPNQSTGQFTIDGLKGFDQMVLDFLQRPSNCEIEKGVHMDEISKHIKIPVQKTMEAIKNLEEEGLIYSTIDEFHYKSIAG